MTEEGNAAVGLIHYGPLVVDYTDIPHDGDKKTLWTPSIGDVLLRLITDWQSNVPWDHGTLFVGQGVDGTVAPPHNCLAFVSTGITDPGGPALGTIDLVYGDTWFDASGASFTQTAHIFHSTDPVQIQLAQTSGTDPTQGYVELHAVVLRHP
jgi:hypothetical protein